MIPRGVDIYLGAEPIDLRWGFDRLCGIVQERIGRRPRSGAVFAFFGRRPRSGAVFAFFGRRRQAMKVFYFDGTGLCVFYKRLDKGTFRFPLSYDGASRTVVLTQRELEDLFAGLDIELPTKH